MSLESHFLDVLINHPDLVIPGFKVQLREDCGPCQFSKQLINDEDGELIGDDDLVEAR